eukprot:140128_1
MSDVESSPSNEGVGRRKMSILDLDKPVSEMTKEEKRELLEKIREAAKGPRLAQLQIKLLDQMVVQLKQRRAKVGAGISGSRSEIRWIDGELAVAHRRYDPLAERLRTKKIKLRELEARLADYQKQFAGIMNNAKQTIYATTRGTRTTTKEITSKNLELLRGYSSKDSHRKPSKKKS